MVDLFALLARAGGVRMKAALDWLAAGWWLAILLMRA
jgi:hypothetical protein